MRALRRNLEGRGAPVDQAFLDRVIERYLSSGDFNGLYVAAENADEIRSAVELVEQGLVQVVSEEDFPNPHIRPWPSKRTQEEQIESLKQLPEARYGVCLYPTPKPMAGVTLPPEYADEPYRTAMARGRGSLELAYFEFEVLEQYRNDPRFSFEFYDFGARTVISDDAFSDDSEPEHDKIAMSHIGFAYDLSDYRKDDPESPIIRCVCAFYGDLAKLTARHQQRWKTYEVDDPSNLEPHPVWWAQQGGHWPDGLGPFERLFLELGALNELTERAYDEPLLASTARPDELGWLLRPSQHEWDAFISTLDKLLSENLRHAALDKFTPRTNAKGETLGTLKRLEAGLREIRVHEDAIEHALQPLKAVRAARQKPAHQLRTNINDRTFIHKQVELVSTVGTAVEVLRRVWQTHPANRDWQEPEYLHADFRVYRM